VGIGAANDDGKGSNSGHLRLYSYNSGTSWSSMGEIDAEAKGDIMGYYDSFSMSDDGHTVAIGAVRNDSGGGNSGNTRIFTYNGGNSWSQQFEFAGEDANDYAGWSVSLSGDGTKLAVGARYAEDEGSGMSNTGKVYIFHLGTNGTWGQIGDSITGTQSNMWFGMKVSISDDGLLVACGAPYSDIYGTDWGCARMYYYNASEDAWKQQGDDIYGTKNSDQTGFSLSLSSDGKIVAILSPGDDTTGSNKGVTKFYYWSGDSAWVQFGQPVYGAQTDGMGHNVGSIDLNSDATVLAVGYQKDDAGYGNKKWTRNRGVTRCYSITNGPTSVILGSLT